MEVSDQLHAVVLSSLYSRACEVNTMDVCCNKKVFTEIDWGLMTVLYHLKDPKEVTVS
jgi:hypothetical protein